MKWIFAPKPPRQYPALIQTLAKQLQASSPTAKRKRLSSAFYFTCVALFSYTYNVNSSRKTAHLWPPGKYTFYHEVIIACIVLSLLGAVGAYIVLASDILVDWTGFEELDRQIYEELQMKEELKKHVSIDLTYMHERIDLELETFASKYDILKLIIAVFSGLLITSAVFAKEGRLDLTFFATLILSILFYVNTFFIVNGQTLRRVSWIFNQFSKDLEKDKSGEAPSSRSRNA